MDAERDRGEYDRGVYEWVAIGVRAAHTVEQACGFTAHLP